MAKKEQADVKAEAAIDRPVVDAYLGADDEDDLSDMKYPDEQGPPPVETHPPETKAEAEALAEAAKREPEPETAESEEQPEEPAAEPAAEAAEEEPEEAKEDDLSSQTVPYSRFKEVNDKAKEAAKRAEELEQRIKALEKPPEPPKKAEPAFDFAAKEAEAMDKLLDGDKEAYLRVREEIRQAEKAAYMAQAEELARGETSELRARMTLEETGARLEAEFPQLVQESEVYDAAAREEALDLFRGYYNSGKYSQVEALDRAVRQVAKLNGWDKPAEEPPAPPTKKTDVKRKVEAAKRQPPTTTSSISEEPGVSAKDIMRMSDEEFEALPLSVKARMRGDIVT